MGVEKPEMARLNEQELTVSTERPRQNTAPPRIARLVVVYPRTIAGSYALAESVTLGRHNSGPGSRVLEHATVSRQHAAIRWDQAAGRHSVVDLGSRNGTWLDGQPVAASLPRFLPDGAVLRIGDVLAVYECGEPAASAPAVSFEALPGTSMPAQRLRAAVAAAAADSAPVLVLGETGVGKEKIASELHRLGGRPGPLIAVNCAALSAHLIESQLFGHVRGAFTGATQERAGLFRAATGGTLFLDELGEMPLELQPKLLRAVELGEVVAVGSAQPHRVDVRLVAATNRSLADEVVAGRFRRDLYARLALWEIAAPPLRSRRADIIDWIDRLHRLWWEPRGEPPAPLDLSVEAAEALLLSPWADNLRGVQRFVHGCGQPTSGRIERETLPRWLTEGELAVAGAEPRAAAAPARPQFRPRPSRDELVAALTAHNWSLRATARHFDRDRKQIARWVEMYAVEIPGRAAD